MRKLYSITLMLLIIPIICSAKSNPAYNDWLHSLEGIAFCTAIYQKAEAIPIKHGEVIVMDIDETILDNSEHEKNYIQSRESLNNWQLLSKSASVPGALHFIQTMKARGAIVIAISGRTPDKRNATILNLITNGIWLDNIITIGDKQKADVIGNISKQYGKVVITVGDRPIDHVPYAYNVKLPNEFYNGFSREQCLSNNPTLPQRESVISQ